MASKRVEGFALRETITLKYEDVEFAGQKPITFVALEFHYTVVNKATRDKILNKSQADPEINPIENNGKPYLSVKIDTDPDTNGASTAMVHGIWYEYDCWVVSSTYGKHRIDTFSFKLDEPETDEFTV